MKPRLLLLVGALLIPFALALSVPVKIVSYTEIVPSPDYTVSLVVYPEVNITNVADLYLKAFVYVYKEPEEDLVFYTDKVLASSVDEYKESPITKIRLYPTEWTEYDDGIYKVVIKVGGYLVYTNGTLEDLDGSNSVTVYIEPKITTKNIDLISISPDLSKVATINREVYKLLVTVRNDGLADIDDARVCLEVYDTYKGFVESYCTKYFDLESGETKTVEVTLDATKLEYGKEYEIKIYAEGAGEKEEKIYYVKVGYPNRLTVTEMDYEPLIVKPGDYVLLKFYVKNEYDKEVVVQPTVVSYDLNLYKNLDTVTLEPLETKEIKAVIKVPEDYKEPVINVFLKLRYDGSVVQYAGKVYVNVKKPEVEILLTGPTTIEKSGTYVLKITNLVEDIKQVVVDAYLEGGIVTVTPAEITLGGKGDTKEVTLKVVGYEEGIKTLKVVIKDAETGKIYGEVTKDVKIVISKEEIPAQEEEKTLPTIPPQYLLAGAAIIIAAAAVYLALKGPKEEKPVQ